MTRAERRRAEKAAQKSKVIYHLTADDIDNIKRDAVRQATVEFERLKQEADKEKQDNLDNEILKALREKDRKFSADLDALILWVLHAVFGFGVTRLRRFWDLFIREHRELRERFGEDAPWKCHIELLKIGVDVDAWNDEYDKENGKEAE